MGVKGQSFPRPKRQLKYTGEYGVLGGLATQGELMVVEIHKGSLRRLLTLEWVVYNDDKSAVFMTKAGRKNYKRMKDSMGNKLHRTVAGLYRETA